MPAIERSEYRRILGGAKTYASGEENLLYGVRRESYTKGKETRRGRRQKKGNEATAHLPPSAPPLERRSPIVEDAREDWRRCRGAAVCGEPLLVKSPQSTAVRPQCAVPAR